MRKTIKTLMTTTVLIPALLLTGCTGSSTPEPTPAPSATVEEEDIINDDDAPESTATPTEKIEPLLSVMLDDSSLYTGNLEENLLKSQNITLISSYVEKAFGNPMFLSGEWKNSESIFDTFNDEFSDKLMKDVAKLNPEDFNDVRTIQSIALFFTPTGKLKNNPSCESVNPLLHGCLTKNVVISDVKVGKSDLGATTAQVSFNVNTAMGLVREGIPVTSEVDYNVKLWVDTESNEIVSIMNDFRISQA